MMDAAADVYFWVKLFAALLVIVTTLHRWIAVHTASWCLSLKRIEEVVIDDGEFVKRPTLQGILSTALRETGSKTVLLYGQRGSGKTSFIRYALKGRRGVLSIQITKKTHDEASKELIEKMSSQVHLLGTQQDLVFMEDVFAACRVPPIIVITMDARCKGEVLEAVLILCKSLSYENSFRRGKQPRFLVDISFSRAAIDASSNLEDLRVVGIQVGNFPQDEALLYATERMPASLKDRRRRHEIAMSVVEKFDCRVYTLQKVCKALRNGHPTDVSTVAATIERELRKEQQWAARGWYSFCCSLSVKFGTPVSNKNLKQVVELLLEGPQNKLTVIGILSLGSNDVMLTERELGLFNADAGFHPFNIDPFESTLSLSGTAITAVLTGNLNTLGEPPSPTKKKTT